MNILIISFYFPPDLSAGSFRTAALVDSLLEQLPEDARIEIITTLPNRYKSFTVDASEVEERSRLTIRRIALPAHMSGMLDQSKSFIVFAKGVVKLSKNKKYDLIFATSSRLMTAMMGAYVSKKYSAPLYLDIRDIFVDTINDVLPKKVVWLVKPVFSLIEGWTIRAAKRVNLVSAGFLSYFKDRYPDQVFTCFTNGIDDEFLGAQPKESLKHTSNILSVVYAGNIGEGQGLSSIIPELAKRLSGRVNFKLIGDGGRKRQLIGAIEAAGCRNVEILPPVKRGELIDLYKNADILFLHLNDSSAFEKVLPSKLFEYAALGKPIWAGVSGFAAEFVRENISNAAIFSPCDVNGAINSLDTLEMVTKPRDDFVEKFSRSLIMKKMASEIIRVAQCRN